MENQRYAMFIGFVLGMGAEALLIACLTGLRAVLGL